MPYGLVIMEWDERAGSTIVGKYPGKVRISLNTLLQIYSMHLNSGEAGMISITSGFTNLVSYFTGPETNYYIVLLLNIDDDPDDYEGGLEEVSRILLQNYNHERYVQIIPSLFQHVCVYPLLNLEQRLVYMYQDEVKRAIIHHLREKGLITLSEMMSWLNTRFKRGYFNIRPILFELTKLKIIKTFNIKDGVPELLALTKDLLMFRVPPLKLKENAIGFGLPPELEASYKKEINQFFENYQPTIKDNHLIIDLLVNPKVYEMLRFFRNTIAMEDDIEHLKKIKYGKIDLLLDILLDNQFIKEFKDSKGKKYYALIADFYIDFLFPKYILNVLKERFDEKAHGTMELLEYLNILEHTYLKQKTFL